MVDKKKKDIVKENKKSFYDRIDKKTGVLSNPNKIDVSVPVSRFPIHLWHEWNKECISKYGGVRWQKVWTDHLKAQSYDQLINQAVQMVKEPEEQQEKEEKKEDVPLTFGDGGK